MSWLRRFAVLVVATLAIVIVGLSVQPQRATATSGQIRTIRHERVLPGTFQPNWRPSCVLYGNAWSVTSLGLNSSNVALAADLSGHGNTMTANGVRQPTLLVGDTLMQGGNSLTFAGGQKLATPAMTITQPDTVIVVARVSTLTGNPGIWDNQTIRQFFAVESAGTQWAIFAGSTLAGGSPNTSMHVFAAVYNGASSALYIDNVKVLSGNTGANSGTGGFSLGNQSTGFLTGAIQEWAIYEEALPTTYLTEWYNYVHQGSRPALSPPSTLVADGNSIVVGNSASPLTLGFAWLTALQFPDAVFTNTALNGESTPNCDINATTLVDPLFCPYRRNNIDMFLEVTNDYGSTQPTPCGGGPILDGGTGTGILNCEAHLQTYVTNRHAAGGKVVMNTVLPNYVIGGTVGTEVDRQLINAWIVANSEGADAVADIGNAGTTMGAPNAFQNATLYVGQLHPTTFGHSLLVPAEVAAVQSLYKFLIPIDDAMLAAAPANDNVTEEEMWHLPAAAGW